MRTSPVTVTASQPYLKLSDGHTAKLFENTCCAIITSPKKVLEGGATVVHYPSLTVVKSGGVGQRRPYLGYLQPNGEVVVRTIDGVDVASGALGYAWDTPAFEAHRQAATAKKGKQ